MPDDLTPDERLVWAATYGAYFATASLGRKHLEPTSDGRAATVGDVVTSGRATADLAVEGLREMKERDDDRS